MRAPRDVVAGDEFDLTVLLDARVAVEIEWCDVRVEGSEAFADDRPSKVFAEVTTRVSGPRTLASGSTALPLRLKLPEWAPRSHSGPGARVMYDVAVHASVPWWLDARAHFALHVVPPLAEPVAGVPRVVINEGHCELSVGLDVVEPGGVIDGRVAFQNAGAERVEIKLVALEMHGAAGRQHASWSIDLEPGASEFAFGVPPDLTPSFASRSFELGYALTAKLRGTSVSVPIRVVDAERAPSRTRVLAPHVGDERFSELLATVAANEGAVVEPGGVLALRVGGAVARLSREVNARGPRMRVHLEYPPLQLGVRLGESALASVLRLARRTPVTGIDACRIEARDLAQARPLVDRLARHVSRASSIVMSDTELRFDVRGANDTLRITRVIADVRAIAELLGEPPPFPTELAPAAREWSDLARDLGGEIEPGHARIVVTTPDAAIEIATLFDSRGAVDGTAVIVRPSRDLPVDTAFNAITDDARVSAETRAAFEKLAEHGRVDVRAFEIRVALSSPLGVGVPVARGREIVNAASNLARALRPSAGPFR